MLLPELGDLPIYANYGAISNFSTSGKQTLEIAEKATKGFREKHQIRPAKQAEKLINEWTKLK